MHDPYGVALNCMSTCDFMRLGFCDYKLHAILLPHKVLLKLHVMLYNLEFPGYRNTVFITVQKKAALVNCRKWHRILMHCWHFSGAISYSIALYDSACTNSLRSPLVKLLGLNEVLRLASRCWKFSAASVCLWVIDKLWSGRQVAAYYSHWKAIKLSFP